MTARVPTPVDPQTALPPPEQFVVTGHRVACDGGGGALGHPRVWLEMGEQPFVDCGYCDRRFVRATGKTPGKDVKTHYEDPSPRPTGDH